MGEMDSWGGGLDLWEGLGVGGGWVNLPVLHIFTLRGRPSGNV